jgi:hypothetical protein
MALVDEHTPPPDSFQGGLPIADIERGTTWWRIHKTPNAPVFFDPTPGDLRPIGSMLLAANIGFST